MSAENWVAVGFLIFIGILVWQRVPHMLLSGLDKRGQKIAAELAEAARLRQEAEKLLKEFEAKRIAAEKEAEAIVAEAKEEADLLKQEAETRLADFVKRRTAQAEQKIAQAETQAAAEVRSAAVDAAVRAAESILRGDTGQAAAEKLLTAGIADVKAKLN